MSLNNLHDHSLAPTHVGIDDCAMYWKCYINCVVYLKAIVLYVLYTEIIEKFCMLHFLYVRLAYQREIVIPET